MCLVENCDSFRSGFCGSISVIANEINFAALEPECTKVEMLTVFARQSNWLVKQIKTMKRTTNKEKGQHFFPVGSDGSREKLLELLFVLGRVLRVDGGRVGQEEGGRDGRLVPRLLFGGAEDEEDDGHGEPHAGHQ